MHGDLAAEIGENVGGAGRLESDDDADLAEAVADGVVDVGRDNAMLNRQQRRVMFSPMVAIELAMASATVPPAG